MKYRWWKTQPLEPCPSNSMWTGSAADLLHQTTDYFLDAANYVVDAGVGTRLENH